MHSVIFAEGFDQSMNRLELNCVDFNFFSFKKSYESEYYVLFLEIEVKLLGKCKYKFIVHAWVGWYCFPIKKTNKKYLLFSRTCFFMITYINR